MAKLRFFILKTLQKLAFFAKNHEKILCTLFFLSILPLRESIKKMKKVPSKASSQQILCTQKFDHFRRQSITKKISIIAFLNVSDIFFVHSFFFHFRRLRVTKLFSENWLSKTSHNHFCTPIFFSK